MLIERYLLLGRHPCGEEGYDPFRLQPGYGADALNLEEIDPGAYPLFDDLDRERFNSCLLYTSGREEAEAGSPQPPRASAAARNSAETTPAIGVRFIKFFPLSRKLGLHKYHILFFNIRQYELQN